MYLYMEYNKMIDPHTDYMGIGASVFKHFFRNMK